MRGVLRDMPARLPADCLLARICARRSFLVHDWNRLLLARQPLDALPSAPWRQKTTGNHGWALHALQQEYFWAFSRMDEQLRRSTSTFLWLAELRTLSTCLRLLSKAATDLNPLLNNSLLANSIRGVLLKANSPAEAVTGLTAVLSAYDSRFNIIGEAWRTGGYGAFESALYDITLTKVCDPNIHPDMRSCMELMIDSRNLTALAKHLRWRLRSLPHLLKGGVISLPRLEKIFERLDNAALLNLAMRLGGEAQYNETADLERVLYEAQDRVMHRLARQVDAVGAILDYLWRCSNEAANISLLEHMEIAGSELATAELRQ